MPNDAQQPETPLADRATRRRNGPSATAEDRMTTAMELLARGYDRTKIAQALAGRFGVTVATGGRYHDLAVARVRSDLGPELQTLRVASIHRLRHLSRVAEAEKAWQAVARFEEDILRVLGVWAGDQAVTLNVVATSAVVSLGEANDRAEKLRARFLEADDTWRESQAALAAIDAEFEAKHTGKANGTNGETNETVGD